MVRSECWYGSWGRDTVDLVVNERVSYFLGRKRAVENWTVEGIS